MRSVTFSQLDRSIEVPRGTTVLEAARRAGIVIESPCNSAGVCGKCLVQLDATSIGNVVQKGMHRLSEAEASLGFVLSCEAEITGDVYVARIPRADHRSLQITGAGIGCRVDLDPFITKEHDAVCDVTTVWGGTAELALETGDTTGTIYGVVVDIGTTTLSASLVDLRTGAELACAGGLNPQSHHAQDVLSRIRFAATAEGL